MQWMSRVWQDQHRSQLSEPPPFQPINLLPSPLLALVASHLPIDPLLQLQRCSSTVYRLRKDAVYMSTAWNSAQASLSYHSTRMHEWALPWHRCITDSSDGQVHRLIPIDLWQSSLPVLKLAHYRDVNDEHNERLSAALIRQPPTTWVWAERTNS